jgi:glutamyl-tRNA synthetase
MGALMHTLRDVMPFDEPHVEAAVRRTAEQQDIKAAVLIHATRVAMTGRTASPGIFEVLVLLGRERALARLDQLASFLSARD